MKNPQILSISLLLCLSSAPVLCESRVDADSIQQAKQEVLAASQKLFDQLVAGSVVGYTTDRWEGVDLIGRPMNRSGFEDPPSVDRPRVWHDRDHFYDRIEILDQDVRLYAVEIAAVRTHAMFFVTTDGQRLRAELRILDLYVKQNGDWLLDLTHVTSVGDLEALPH